MPISGVASRSARSSSTASCTSTSTAMPSSRASVSSVASRRVVERRDDQQDAIRTERPRLDDLVFVEHEVLAQHRQRACRRAPQRDRRPALEELAVGQHRKAGRAARLVAARDRGRIEDRPQHAAAGARLLDLGDHAGRARADPRCAARRRSRAPAARFAPAARSGWADAPSRSSRLVARIRVSDLAVALVDASQDSAMRRYIHAWRRRRRRAATTSSVGATRIRASHSAPRRASASWRRTRPAFSSPRPRRSIRAPARCPRRSTRRSLRRRAPCRR